MVFIHILMAIYILVSATVIGYDILKYEVDNISHYHIGRWESVADWEKAVSKICRRWAVKTPGLQMNDQYRYLLLDRIQGEYTKAMVQSWQKAGCLLGLLDEKDFHTFQTVKKKLVDKNGSWRFSVERVDYAMLAFVLLKAERQPQKVKPAMDAMISCLEANLCEDGMISYSAGKANKRRYVDTLGFVCPFLALYAKCYDAPYYEQLAMNQYRKYREHGMMQGIPVHCFTADTNLPIGIYGWGRGIGWYTTGLIDMYFELSATNQKEALDWITEISECVGKFERSDGGYSTIVQTQHHYDSSATAMIGYFCAKGGMLLKKQEMIDVAKNCRAHLMKVTKKSGVIDEALADTRDIGVFSQRYGSMPYVQGMAKRLSTVLAKIEE